MTKEERLKIWAQLAAPLPEEAIERTNGKITGKGYDTLGYRTQYILNRINEVVGVGGYRAERTTSVREITRASGRPAFEAVCEVRLQLGEWIDGAFVPWAEAIADGGHVSATEADARKGSFSNGLKKAASFFGCGRHAFEGSIDDDNAPADEPTQFVPTRRSAEAVAPTPPQKLAPQPLPSRSRLTSKQLNAVWALAQRNGQDKTALRTFTVEEYGCQPEYLNREQASHLIESLGLPLKTNGSGNGSHYAAREPGQEG